MKIRLTNVLSLYLTLILGGSPIGIAAQMSKADLLTFLETPFAPIPAAWKALSYPAAVQLGSAVLTDHADKNSKAVLTLLTKKALESSLPDQEQYLEYLLGQILPHHPSLNYSIWQAARQFPKEAFSRKAQGLLQQHLRSSPQYLDRWLLLAGFATRDPSPIRQLIAERPGKSIQQAGKLALVRMGQAPYADNFLRNIKRIPIDDDFVYDLAPLAIYTRDTKVIAYLVDIILKEQGQCHPADAETSGEISCAYRLIELLGPVLRGFPSLLAEEKAEEAASLQPQLKAAKKWLKSHRKQLPIDRQFW